MKLQREKQKDLIEQLKNQLQELESYAYETGEAGLPQSVLLERHKLQSKGKANAKIRNPKTSKGANQEDSDASDSFEQSQSQHHHIHDEDEVKLIL